MVVEEVVVKMEVMAMVEEEDEEVQEVACQQHTKPSRLDQPPAKLAHLIYS